SIHLALTGLLITVISLLPGVSGAGHLGGAVAGAVAAVLLHLHRFGSRPVRVLALASLLVLAPAGVFLLKERSDRDPGWKPAIEKADQETFADLKQRLEKLEKSQHALNESHLEELLGIHPNRRDPQLLREALDELPDLIEQFRDAADHLDRMGPLRSEQAEKQRLAALDYFQKRADLLELIQRHLKDKMNWQNQEARAKEVIRAQGRWRRSREQ
ncbi:MAG: hypothetical protein HYS12_10225, partial [Planctomycetes bacterium]|nr:hypothetical protein [Planctomycetota bacterium]